MIENWSYLWLFAGVATGLIHAGSLLHESRSVSVWSPIRGLLRLFLIVAVLVLAARSEFLMSAAAGWAVGFLPTVVWLASGSSHARLTGKQIKHGTDD
jgi:hypothetical protein